MMLKIRCNVLGPTHAGRVNFNILNRRTRARTRAHQRRQQLGAVCRALSITALLGQRRRSAAVLRPLPHEAPPAAVRRAVGFNFASDEVWRTRRADVNVEVPAATSSMGQTARRRFRGRTRVGKPPKQPTAARAL